MRRMAAGSTRTKDAEKRTSWLWNNMKQQGQVKYPPLGTILCPVWLFPSEELPQT